MSRVSVITTVRNGASFIGPCIESTIAQTDGDWEMIIVDDGSTDATADVIAGFDDARIELVQPGAIGRAAALNIAVDQAQSSYLAILDADDVSVPDRHMRQADLLDARPELAYVGASRVPQIDASGDVLLELDQNCVDHEQIVAKMRRGVSPTEHSTAMLRRNLVKRVGGYDLDLPCGLDHDIFVRLLAHGRVEHLPDPVAYKRNHDGQHFWGPSGVGQLAAERFRYSRQVQANTVRILGASRASTFVVPTRYWAKALLKPLVRPLTPSGRVWRRMSSGPEEGAE